MSVQRRPINRGETHPPLPTKSRVLVVTECFTAGTGRVVRQLAKDMPEIEWHLLWDGPQEDRPGEEFMTQEQLKGGVLARTQQVRRRVVALQPDLVHAHSSWAGVYTRLFRLERPVVYQPHCFAFATSAL